MIEQLEKIFAAKLLISLIKKTYSDFKKLSGICTDGAAMRGKK